MRRFRQLVINEKGLGDYRAFLHCEGSDGKVWVIRGGGGSPLDALLDTWITFTEEKESDWNIFGEVVYNNVEEYNEKFGHC